MVVAPSGGGGLGVARALAAEGADISLCARDPQALARAHVEVNALGAGDVLSMPADLRDDFVAAEWVRRTADAFGGPDIVVTDSGGLDRPPDGFRISDYRAAIDADVLTHISVTLAALPCMKVRGGGRVMMIAPAVSGHGTSEPSVASVTRMGLLGYMRGLVRALGDTGVTVNVLSPGARRTPDPPAGLRGVMPYAGRAFGPNGRGAVEPAGDDGLGSLAVYLAGDTGAAITGTAFGGYDDVPGLALDVDWGPGRCPSD
ncbi:SDR family oxidoreductase [Streptomyces sp. NPDC047315]|uniref:SDR family NAD(P)-dependent oxidoreductase n=1 Tax=Streptomyces sp. NPDC047315 TaxID=3155142 RepID=UPI0033E37282